MACKSFLKAKIIFTPVVFFLLSGSCSTKGEPSTGTSRPRDVAVSVVQERDLSSARIVTAPVTAYKRVYINARTGGEIMELLFEEGDRVKKGQLLARVDTRSQLAQLRNAESALEDAKRNYNRTSQLYENNVVSTAEYEMAQRQLEKADSELQYWRTEAELGDIYAPFSAVISDKLVELGTTVSVNQRVYTIEDHELLVVRPGVSELDVAFLNQGQEMEMKFDVFGDKLFRGRIRRVFPSADRITRLFTVEVEIDQQAAGHTIRPGYLARVYFVTDQRTDVPAVPSESLTLRNGETLAFVVKENGQLEKRIVERGVERDGWIEIAGGLVQGERVVTGNLDALDEGMEVNITGTFRRFGFGEREKNQVNL